MKGHFLTIILAIVFVFFADLASAQLGTRIYNHLPLYRNSNKLKLTQLHSPLGIGYTYQGMPVLPKSYFVQKDIFHPNFEPGGNRYVDNSELKYLYDQSFEAFIPEKTRKPVTKGLNGILQNNIYGSSMFCDTDNPIFSGFFIYNSYDAAPNCFVLSQPGTKNNFPSGNSYFLKSTIVQNLNRQHFFNENSAIFLSGKIMYGDKYGISTDSYLPGNRYFSVNDKSFRYVDTLIDTDPWYDYYFLLWFLDVMYELTIYK